MPISAGRMAKKRKVLPHFTILCANVALYVFSNLFCLCLIAEYELLSSLSTPVLTY